MEATPMLIRNLPLALAMVLGALMMNSSAWGQNICAPAPHTEVCISKGEVVPLSPEETWRVHYKQVSLSHTVVALQPHTTGVRPNFDRLLDAHLKHPSPANAYTREQLAAGALAWRRVNALVNVSFRAYPGTFQSGEFQWTWGTTRFGIATIHLSDTASLVIIVQEANNRSFVEPRQILSEIEKMMTLPSNADSKKQAAKPR